MILKRLAVRNFGRLGDGEWTFAPGANVVRGPNEAGKSTLAEAVAMALLGASPVTGSSAEALRWKTWGRQEMYRLEAEFSQDGGDWRIVRDYAEGRSLLENLATGEQVADDKKVRAMLADMGGLAAERSHGQYLATGYLRQGEWARLAGDEAGGIADLLGQALAASGGYSEKAIRDLRRELEDYNRGVERAAPKNPGPVARARDRRDEIRAKIEGAEGVEAQRARARREQQARKQLLETSDGLAATRAELAEAGPKLEAVEARRKLDGQYEDAKRKADASSGTLSRAQKLSGQVEELGRRMSSRQKVTREATSELTRKQEEARRLREAARQHLKSAEEVGATAQKTEAEAARVLRAAQPSRSRWMATGMLALLGVLALAATGLAWASLPAAAKAVLVGLGVVFLVVGVSLAVKTQVRIVKEWVRARGHAEGLQHEAALRREQAGQHRVQASAAEATASELAAGVERQLDDWGMKDLASALVYVAETEQLEADRKSAEDQLAGLLQGRELLRIEAELVALRADMAMLEGQIGTPEMQAAALSDEEYLALRRRASDLEQEERRWTVAQAQTQGTLEANRGAGEALLAAEADLQAAEAEYRAAQHRRRVLAATVRWIDDAVKDARRSVHETVEPRASRMLERLTAGHYRKLGVGGGLEPAVTSPEKGAAATEEELSYATREQVYLALRLAMCESLWPQEGPPLILDEPLLAFDAERREAALALLSEVAGRRQVIILTCAGDYDGLAANPIELDSA